MRAWTGSVATTPLRAAQTFVGRAFAGVPEYPATAADRATFSVLGLRLPVRATMVVSIVVFALLFDYRRDFVPSWMPVGRDPLGMRTQALDRLVIFGIVPLLAILAVLRDDPRRYGLRLGEWRLGLPLALAGCTLMTPIVLLVAAVPEFRSFYGESATSLPNLLVTNTIDLFSAEFLLRGFLMFTLLRIVGPVGVLLATVPFVFSHLGKPELETLSTLFGGMCFGWLNWRTGSILYSGLAHVFILSLVMVAAAAQ